MDIIKISAVSYLNARPFIYGLQHSGLKGYELSLDTPVVCAQKLLSGTVNLGLVPVAVIPQMKEHHIVSDYCIGADGDVSSVMLFSQVPLPEIRAVLLDNQSLTSVQLTRILAKKLWKVTPQWIDAREGYESRIEGSTAGVVIGDRALFMQHRFPFACDLSGEWKRLTGLPFVFACWVSGKKLPAGFERSFSGAMLQGITSIDRVVKEIPAKDYPDVNIASYLGDRISYILDAPKREALELFLGMMQEEQG